MSMLLMPLPVQQCSECEKSEQLKIKLNVKPCGLIPSFQNIENHTMRDINQFIEAALEQRVYGTTADVEDID